MRIFDFVSNAKVIKFGMNKETPEFFQFEMSVGNDTGIIGYGQNRNNDKVFFSKTTRNKKIYDICDEPGKIILILSKSINDAEYTKLEYERKKGLYDTYKDMLNIETCFNEM